MIYRYLLILGLLFLPFTASPARAASTVSGCLAEVVDAIAAKVIAFMAYDNAVASEFMDKPDSVLALTCFNDIARMSASGGKTVTSGLFKDDNDEFFSGDFTAEMSNVLSAGLGAHYSNYTTGTLSERYNTKPGLSYGDLYVNIDIGAANIDSTSFECNAMENLWEAYMAEGVRSGVPYISFDDLLSNTPPVDANGNPGGDNFQEEWVAAANKGVFSDLASKVNNLPPNNATDFSGSKTSCEVLIAAGILSGGPC